MSAAPETVRLDRAGEFQPEVARTELLDVYRVVIDEYRFQVRLNWDRTQYYFVLNSAMATAGATILATLKPWGAAVAIFVFLIGCAAALLGHQAVLKGHEYYRRVVYRKTLLEDLLGRLHKLPGYAYDDAALNLATTGGMAEARKILDDTAEYFAGPARRGTIHYRLLAILRIFLLADIAGVVIAVAVLA